MAEDIKTNANLENEPKNKASEKKEEKVKIILKNTIGKVVDEEDYFFGGSALPSFNKVCGLPVDREDMLTIFHSVFKPEDGILFYKAKNKEVYIVIVPLKFSKEVGVNNNSINGDFHKHAISFIGDGSVNLDTLKLKLKRIVSFVAYDKR